MAMSDSQPLIPPLSAQTIELLAQYLLPPTSTHIPKEYLSIPLQQRHRFLSLNPDNPLDYLCWPNPDSPSVIEHLFSIPRNSLQPLYLRSQTVYSSDGENIIARVPIDTPDSHIQLLFLHHPGDTEHPWKYHDAQLLPLPAGTYTSLQAALNSIPQSSSIMDYPESADAFWEGYGSSGASSPVIASNDQTISTDNSAEQKAEQDYWARYSDIQGTADSTIPSPRVPRQTFFKGSEVHLNPVDLDYRTLPSRETPSHQEIAKVLTGLSAVNLTVPSIEISNGPPKYEDNNAEVDATEAALNGIFRMWKLQNPNGGKADFMAIVERALR